MKLTSIHSLYQLYCVQGNLSQLPRRKRQDTSRKGCQSIMWPTQLDRQPCTLSHNHTIYVIEKRVVGLTFAASYGKFINQNNIETCTTAWKRRVSTACTYSLWDSLIFPHIILCIWPKPNLCLAPLCLRLLQHLCHRLDREHSDPKHYVVWAVSRPCSLPHIQYIFISTCMSLDCGRKPEHPQAYRGQYTVCI